MAYFPYGGKSIFYEEFGQGSPVLFLHGNTASSKMFELLMPLYAEKFRCILLDFLGNGRSDRVERFSPDLWQEEARQTIALVEYLQCGKVSLVGTSGGAWAAVNAALLRPDLFHAVVADTHAECPLCRQSAGRAECRKSRPPGPAVLSVVPGG